jgi:PAS domain S-box-containing protein
MKPDNRKRLQSPPITERKEAEERILQLSESLQAQNAKLESERARWKGVVEGIADEVWLCDNQVKISLVNLPDVTSMGLQEFSDWSLAEVLQEVDVFYVDGTPRPAEEAPLLRSLRTGEIVRGEELMHYRRTGKMRYRQFSCAPTRDATTGIINGAVAIVRDITTQKEIEAALRESEERLRRYELLAMHSRDIILFMNSDDGRLLEVNTAAVEAYGYTREELLKLTIHELRMAETRELTSELMAKAVEHGIQFETVHRRKDGSTFPVEVSSQGAMIGKEQTLISVVRDITERKQAEEALAESERRYRGIVETSEEGIATHEPDGTITYVNQRMADMLGYSCEELIGRSSLDFVDDEEREAVIRAREIVKEQGSFSRERKLHRKDGSILWTLSNISQRQDGAGNFLGFLAMHTDITHRKQAEEVLHKAHSELALQMEERIKELREKEVLLKEVHHRVKNNLQVISSLVGMQADTSRDDTVRGVLQDVIYRVRSMALVHEKLYHSESLARIDFAEYARSLLGYLWRAHGAAAEFVRLTLDLEPIELQVDIATPCGLILNELAGNALKHAFKGRTEGEVEVSLQLAETGVVCLSVRDNGVGLPEGFDWRQAGSLGLRLVQMLAGQLQASVEVDGHGGTEFTVSFRLKSSYIG